MRIYIHCSRHQLCTAWLRGAAGGYGRSVSRWEGKQVGVGIARKDRGTEGGTVDNRWIAG